MDGKPLDEPYVHFIEAPLRPDDPEYGLRGDSRSATTGGRRWCPPGSCSCSATTATTAATAASGASFPIDQVKGRALLVYWSYEATREEYHRTGVVEWLRDTSSAFGRTRWKRFFHVIR